MTNSILGVEQELYLAPEKEKIKNAEEIAELSLDTEKYPFIIQYIPTEKESIISELEKIGGIVLKQLDFANCVVVLINMSQLKAIKTLDYIEAVEKDYDYKILTNNMKKSEFVSYLAGENPQVNVRKEIKLAVFDTGISNTTVNGSVNFVDDSDATEDKNGHGTQMAGIVSSVIANIENKKAIPVICSAIVADHRGFAKTSTIMEAIDWAICNDIKIINMSLGDYHKSNFLENMINKALKCGIIMVAAAGNDGEFKDENRIMYPAAFNSVLSVGAKNDKTVANYSNGGIHVDCLASGTQNTRDIDGNALTVTGTSASAAFVTGFILKNWCINPDISAENIIAAIKTEITIEPLTLLEKNDNVISTKDNENLVLNAATLNGANTVASNSGISLLCDDGGSSCLPDSGDDDCSSSGESSDCPSDDSCSSGNENDDCTSDAEEGCCSSNDMSSAINLMLSSWRVGLISCPGNENWFKFTANVEEAHPNGSSGWYDIQTQGSLDTIGYLYDSYGNQIGYSDDANNNLNFKIIAHLEYNETYYIRVKAYGNNTGTFSLKVGYVGDDHGNTPDTATEIVGVYYEDKSVNGYLHSYGDVDYYTFVSARDCVMEIYTEGETDTYGSLYCVSGGLLYSDSDSNGNGNFKITAYLESYKRYYIAVSHNSSTGYGDYTLRFKFVKDYSIKTNVISATWYNDTYDPLPYDYNADNNIRCKIWLNHSAANKWYYDVITNADTQSKLSEFVQDFNETVVIDYIISKLPFSSNYILSIGASVLLGMLIDVGNPDESKEQFLDSYMRIDPDNSKMSYVCGTAGTIVSYILYQPIEDSAYDIMGYAYDDADYFYGLQYCRGRFICKYN